MKSEVKEANEATKLQHEQKIQIRTAAQEDIKRKDKEIEEIEELLQKQKKELEDLKIERVKLKIHQEALEEARELLSISKNIPKQKSNPSSQKLPEVVTHTPVVPVTTPQPQNGTSAGNQTIVAVESGIVSPAQSEKTDEFAMPSGVQLTVKK